MGRQPHLLLPLEGGYLEDFDVRGQNDLAGVREIAAVAIIEATVEARLRRGDYHKQIAAQERAEHQPADLVDIWYDPPSKDTPGWRGPAQIASVNVGEGNVIVRFQGRTLDRRRRALRVHVLYLVYPATLISSHEPEWSVLKREVETLKSASVIVGTVFQGSLGT